MTVPPEPDAPETGAHEFDAGVDALLGDDALLDALGRGELPASYRADVTARLLTSWRDDLHRDVPDQDVPDQDVPDQDVPDQRDLGRALPSGADAPTAALVPVLLATVESEPSTVAEPLADDGDDTMALPRYDDEAHSRGDSEALPRGEDAAHLPIFAEPDRIDESVRSAFVAAGYARPAGEYPSGRPSDEPTQQLGLALEALAARTDEPVVPDLAHRRSRRRRLDRIVVAAAATAAVLAAGSAGSVAAAATAHPGDPLWPISKVVYADRARSIVASEEAHAAIAQAREAAERGDTEAAERYLAKAREKLHHHVREGSEEADELAEELQTTAALPQLRSSGDPAVDSPNSEASSSARGSDGTKQRRGGRGNGNGNRNGGRPAPPYSVSTPTPAPGPGGPAPTVEPSAPPEESTSPTSPESSQPPSSPEPTGSESPAAGSQGGSADLAPSE